MVILPHPPPEGGVPHKMDGVLERQKKKCQEVTCCFELVPFGVKIILRHATK